jgi:opacity protein-like surface antigen
MRVHQALPVALSVVVLTPSLAIAQGSTREPGLEFGLDAVYQFSKDVSFDGGTRLSLDDTVGADFTIRYRFNPKLEAQFGFDWNTIHYRGTLRSAQNPLLRASVRGDMDTYVPHVDGVWNFTDAPLTPFVTVGVGWAFVDTNIPTGQVQVGCWWDPWWGQICTPYRHTKTVDAFTYQVGAGVRWDFGRNATARFAYQRIWADLNKATSTPGFDQLKLGFAWRY